jgi:hypothetical protein
MRGAPRGLWQGFKRLTQLGWPRSFPIVQFPNAPLIIAARRMSQRAPGPQHQDYLTVPPEALIAYHMPPNDLAPT